MLKICQLNILSFTRFFIPIVRDLFTAVASKVVFSEQLVTELTTEPDYCGYVDPVAIVAMADPES